MSCVGIETIEETRRELDVFVKDNFAYLQAIISEAPTAYSIRSASYAQDAAWRIGFTRCLVELRRIAKEVKKREGDV